ncbi:MAG: hypothetical protein E3J21_01330 [Anaerolineales bacterium]|nr:MAG: hypothetical protein E3J21_01330 [Anaerolineales bacterium]
MAYSFGDIIHDIARRRTSRGRTTGPYSRLLSGVCNLLFIYILVSLFKDKYYIPLVALVALVMTPIAPLAVLGSFIYFLYVKYWTGVILLAVLWLIGWLSVRFGIRYNAKRITGQAAYVDPFEGMPDVGTAGIIQLCLFALALLIPGTLAIPFWVLFGLATAYRLFFYYFRLRSPWATLHYPLMLRYTAICASQMAMAARQGEQYSAESTLHALVTSAYPGWTSEQVVSLISSAKQKMLVFTDREPLEHCIRSRNPSLDRNALSESMGKIQAALNGPDRDAIVLGYAIAEIVGRDFGDNERTKYLAEFFSGRAR